MGEKAEAIELFLPVPNVFITNGEMKLTPEELYLYYYIIKHELNWLAKTSKLSVDIISQELKIMKDSSQNKTRINKLLFSLKGKQAISFEDIDIKNSSLVEIKFMNIDDFVKTDRHVRGFEKIPFKIFDMAKTPLKFFILCLICRKSEIPYSTIAELADVEDSTAKKVISEMLDDGVLNYKQGRFYIDENKNTRQEVNQYWIGNGERKEENVEGKDIESNEVIQLIETNIADINIEDTLDDADVDWGNWNKKVPGSFKYMNLTLDDIVLYYWQKDRNNGFKEYCDKRRETLFKTNFSHVLKKYDAIAKDKIYKLMNAKAEKDKEIEGINKVYVSSKFIKEKQMKLEHIFNDDGIYFDSFLLDDIEEKVV